MSNIRGFTIIEIAIVMAILGIIASISLFQFKSGLSYNELEKAANNLYKELSGARSIAFKNDEKVLIRFNDSACSLFVDLNKNNSTEAGELQSVYRLSQPVFVGIAADGPTSGPGGIAFMSTGIAGGWETYMEVIPDAVGTINAGAVYLKSTQVKKMQFCIGITNTTQKLKLFKWDGSAWIVL